MQDLAKSRVLLRLVKELEDNNFRVILQTRAGLDFFKPDIDEAKAQLAAVTAMMDDIDPKNIYSEALYLATPDIIDESIKITRHALKEYRIQKWNLGIVSEAEEQIRERQYRLERDARKILKAMEENIENLYSPAGLYIAFVAGWLPVPQLWSDSEEFLIAKNWQTQIKNGGVEIVENGAILPVDVRINRCISNIPQAKYILNTKYGG